MTYYTLHYFCRFVFYQRWVTLIASHTVAFSCCFTVNVVVWNVAGRQVMMTWLGRRVMTTWRAGWWWRCLYVTWVRCGILIWYVSVNSFLLLHFCFVTAVEHEQWACIHQHSAHQALSYAAVFIFLQLWWMEASCPHFFLQVSCPRVLWWLCSTVSCSVHCSVFINAVITSQFTFFLFARPPPSTKCK